MHFLESFVLLFLFLFSAEAEYFRNMSIVEDIRTPNFNNDDCIAKEANYDIRTYNEIEVVNALNDYPLRELLSERNIMPTDNPYLNRYLLCIWQQRLYINNKNEINYPLLESVISDSVAKVVGNSGPGILLSKLYARNILVDCHTMTGDNIGIKLAKIQNHIAINLKKLVERV